MIGLFVLVWNIKLEKRKKIITAIASVIISILLLFVFVVPFIGYHLIREGMSENDVRDVLGEPKYNSRGKIDGTGMGTLPDLPWNTTFRYYNYFIESYFFDDQIIIIFFVSANDYYNLTGQNVEDSDWIVIEKHMHPSSWIS